MACSSQTTIHALNQWGDVRLIARDNIITGSNLGLARYVHNGTSDMPRGNGTLRGTVDASRNYWGLKDSGKAASTT